VSKSGRIPFIVHATHEAGVKIGGIGAVLDGLLGADAYNQHVERTIVTGPMEAGDKAHMERLLASRNGLTIRYGSLQGIFDGVSREQFVAFQNIEQRFKIAILYGTRRFGSYEHEVLLIDATAPDPQPIDTFKYFVWDNYGLDSGRYNYDAEYRLHFAIAQPLLAALTVLQPEEVDSKFIIAHEWMGMPLVFAAQLIDAFEWYTVFYAHEVATVRRLVEEHPGHDTRFYNVLRKAGEWGLDLDAVFGNQNDFYKHAIIKLATRCNNIFAVGDLVVDELRFLGHDFAHTNINLVYNGIPSAKTTLKEKLASKAKLQQYCQNLLGYWPDYVFTHVTRFVSSKALWRDLPVLNHLDAKLSKKNKRAVLFVLSTSAPAGRRSEWVAAWEEQYGWPVGHRGDNGDLIGDEAPYFFQDVSPFNQAHEQGTQVVLVNQFGWDQERCGRRMPAEMEFIDVRRGSDLEFGQSTYEPFGIAQVEPLSHGALCCVSSVCGCVGFVQRVAAAIPRFAESIYPNLVVADYVNIPYDGWVTNPQVALEMDAQTRQWMEEMKSAEAAHQIFERLPKSDTDLRKLLKDGQAVAQKMSWDVVVAEYLLPGLERAKNN